MAFVERVFAKRRSLRLGLLSRDPVRLDAYAMIRRFVNLQAPSLGEISKWGHYLFSVRRSRQVPSPSPWY